MKLPFVGRKKELQHVESQSWWTRIFDWTPGAWQTNDAYDTRETSVLANPTVFSCMSLIQGGVAAMSFTVEQDNEGVWTKVPHAVLDVLKKPNKYQNQIQFRKQWIGSKLTHGNTYVLKVRDPRGNIIGLVALDPLKVKPLIADNGDIYYQLTNDKLPGIEDTIVVPSSEIIHDRDNCIYHPLVGLSPLFAGAESARISNAAIRDSKHFMENGAKQSGLLSAPGNITDETAKRLKDYFENNFTGEKAGKIAVVGDGLKFEQMRMTSVDAQLVEQLRWSDEKICSVFHVPPYMVGVGGEPTYNNIEARTIQYYTQCLQDYVLAMEEGLNQGLSIQKRFRIRLDEDELFRMDKSTLVKTLNDGVGGGWMAPDEARRKFNLPPVPGGRYPYLQQQNYSLEALAQRDASEPFATPEPPPMVEEELSDDDLEQIRALSAHYAKELTL
jgi:HK97 family phage portal protein